MEPKGRLQFVFDFATGKWVKWSGTAAGFGGVVLFASDGTAIGVDDGANDNINPNHILDVASLNYLQSGGSWDRWRALPSDTDAQAESQDGLAGVVARLYGYNGATFDRLRSYSGSADDITDPTLGLLGVAGFNRLHDGTNWDRARSLVTNADATVAALNGLAGVVARPSLFNGATYDRLRNNAAANLSAANQPFAEMVANPGEWAINHTPAAATQATITRAAGAAGVRHVCRSITISLIGLAAAVEATILVNLRDGATGAGTILWSTRLLVTGTTGSETGVTLANLNIFGSAATAMTLEFAAAGAANTFESVALTGYDSI